MSKDEHLVLLFWNATISPAKYLAVSGPNVDPAAVPLELGEWTIKIEVAGDNVKLQAEILVTLTPPVGCKYRILNQECRYD